MPKKKKSKVESTEQPERSANDRRDRESSETASKPGGAADSLASAVLGLSKLYSQCGKNGVSPEITDAVSQALLLILGSGPSIAAFDDLMNVQVANGIMYQNAVANQQKTNLLGMAMTAKCVRYMLNPQEGDDFDETIVTNVENEPQ